ncbi:MAG: sugar phosphate isomerase/epimerase [Eubacteriales bacterium]|nr:sugar phosphate isomerase/epimerase [Eubacteriales bacterium]
MIYLSQLIPDKELKLLINEYHTGLELIDFSVGTNLDEMTVILEMWERKLEMFGAPPITIHGPFLDLNPVSFDSLAAQAAQERFAQAYEAARQLHAQKIIYHTCRIPLVCYVEGWAERMADFWNSFLEKHWEVPVAIENVFDEAPEPIADFASRIQAANFSLCLDFGHINYASGTPADQWLDVLGPWAGHLHLHDNHGKSDDHLALGKGNINWKKVLEQINSMSLSNSITIENSTPEDFRTSLEYCREHKLSW